ncbi:MAG TPA: aldehyde ferredoxin oxidoreductase, partial [Rhodobacteraceae bacterium]|nr:aldehyde ferredoxin oxidoreductase [Paracoccaceae bacterium]
MRRFLDIDLATGEVATRQLEGAELARAGRYLIARMLNDEGVAKVDPLGPDNPLIFSAGPFAGTNFSNANRISVGCKSPLTGGIKEANSGGTFATALGQLEIAGLALRGQASAWRILHIGRDGVRFEDATPFLADGVFATAAALHAAYGDKASLALIGPVAEYGGLMAGICFTDVEGRPARLAARGGVGAVMASKKIKAIVVDKHKMPPLNDLKAVMEDIRAYSRALAADRTIQAFSSTGTAMVADLTNHLGALPVNNFSAGSLTGKGETLRLGGDFIREQNTSRGGKTSHACMRGCKIKCSNVYVDAKGDELVSPLEYETLGLMGSNCGLTDPDDVARVNWQANDLGVDTIELGAMIGVLMQAGIGAFGDVDFMHRVLDEIRAGSETGRLYAQGTARVGAHFKVARVPVIKGQAISAYDPRVIEVTGVSMMLTAQGADHTAGNLPGYKSADKDIRTLVEKSLA